MGDKDPINAKKKLIPQQSYLSEDLIIEEILTRLPVKSILRFKSVSKQWYSTLSSSDFANAHLIKSRSAPVNTLFIKSFKHHYLFSYDDNQISGNFEDNLVELDSDLVDNLVKLDAEFDVAKDYLQLIGCCDGLVCLKLVSQKYFVVWNPATRKLNKYMSDGYFLLLGCGIIYPKSCFEAHGFGYASSVDDYKYVRILVGCFRNETFGNCFHIFCLRENKWRKLEFDYDNVILPRGGAVLINEKLYWNARNLHDGNIIVSFDLGVERFDLIKADLDDKDLLGFMGGSLSKCNHDTVIGDKLLHILEPPAIVKSISLPEGLGLYGGSEMIGFTRTGKFFVTGVCNDEPRDDEQRSSLGIVDTRTKPVRYTMLLKFDFCLWIARYVPSLVSPFANGEPSEE